MTLGAGMLASFPATSSAPAAAAAKAAVVALLESFGHDLKVVR